MSSWTAPSGKRNACSSQKDRRQSLFHAVRSETSGVKRVMWVLSLVRVKIFAAKGDCFGPPRRSRWMLPVAKSDPVSSSAPMRRS